MKASEALLLGSTLIKPQFGSVGKQIGEPGCALGMIGEATGNRSSNFLDQFEVLGLRAVLPCSCSRRFLPPFGDNNQFQWDALRPVVSCIIHLFDYHVCENAGLQSAGYERWTIEQLAQWLAGMENLVPEKPEAQEQKEELPCSASISS